MNRPVVGLLLAVGAAACFAIPSRAQDGAGQALPLKDVVLFSSGVGYFQREGQINGSVTVPLSFRAEKVNDILKSLVLFDPNGNVRPVTYQLPDAVSGRLSRVGQQLDASVTLGALLRHFQGARVRLEMGGEAVEGRLISVSSKAIPVKDIGIVQTDVVNVLTESGLRAVPLDQVTQVKLLDERLDRELRETLERLATGLDDQQQKVELRFGGNAARQVRAGYLQETPVWKTSYRLVLDKDQKPYVQGWAIVENTSEEDWKEVSLSLVSGRPVSFIQDLYQPLYVPRPVIQAQVIGSPLPQTYGETLELGNQPADSKPALGGIGGRGFEGFGGAPGPRGPAGERAAPGGAPAAPPAAVQEFQARRKSAAMSAEQLAQSVASQAEGTERGALFEYAIRQPLTLPKGQAAMVPIVTTEIGGEALSIYDPDSDAKRVLNGFRLKNTTGMHLSGGPITVFREGTYAGDGQITNLQPNEDRLISYAVDLELVANHEEPKFRQDTLSVVAKSGVLQITRKQQKTHVYTFRNKSDKAKTVLVQQDMEEGFKLAEPAQAAEKTPDEYRFKLEVPANKTNELKVVTERPVLETIALLDINLDVLVAYAQNAQLSEKLRGSLKELVSRRRKITELQSQRARLDAEVKTIDQEQARIRQNMAQLDRNSPLYQQYVKKLTDQETRIEKLREEIARVQEAETAAQKELREYVETLTAD